jgi:methyl-accepting chemotaxis protein
LNNLKKLKWFLVREEESRSMFGSLKKIFKLFNPHNMKDRLGPLSTTDQFMIVFQGFAALIILQVILGISLLMAMNVTIGRGIIRPNQENRLLTQLKVKLAEIQIIGNEKYSGISNRSHRKLFNEVERRLQAIAPQLVGENSKTMNQRLSRISEALEGTVTYDKYQIVRSEVSGLRNLLTKREQMFRRSRAGEVSFNLFIVLLVLSMLIAGAGLVYWTIVSILLANEHQYANRYFENIALKYRQNRLEKEIAVLPSAEALTLKMVLEKYFGQVRERYERLRTHSQEMLATFHDLESAVNRNDEHCFNVKDSLRGIINDTYHRLDFFPELAEHIKNLNISLSESQQESAGLHQSVEKAGKVFENSPVNVGEITREIDTRDEHTQEITAGLRELRKIIDNIQQIVTIFDSIAQQTTVLSLNASIEAARAGAAGGGFDIAATEIDVLADRIGVIPPELLKIMSRVQKRMLDAIRTNEAIVPQHRQSKRHFETISTELNSFWQELESILNELREFGKLAYQFETREKSLEEFTVLLADLNRQIPVNYGKVLATLDVVGKSEQLPVSLDTIMELLDSLNQKLDEIVS